MLSVLFVCTGNICRSPTADGVMRAKVAEAGLTELVRVDGCGTDGWHVGEPPDPRSQHYANSRGYDLSELRARRLEPADFARFDYLLAMDHGHLKKMLQRCPPAHRHKLSLFLDHWADAPREDVPDPYYGADDGFTHVLDLVEGGCDALLAKLKAELDR